jgi:HlyD family secretion protein
MSNKITGIATLIKLNWKKILLAVVLGALLSLYLINKSENNNKVVTESPIRKDITEVVELSGPVEPVTSADLSFEKSGVVSFVKPKVGDKVYAGETLATLSGADAYAAVREAEAGVASAQATLDQLQSGATESELNIKEQALASAKIDLQNAETQISDTVRNTQNSLTDIVNYKLASLFVKNGADYKMSFSSCDQFAQTNIESERRNFDFITVSDLDSASLSANNLNSFLNKLNTLLTLPCSLADSSLSANRLTVSMARASVSTIFADISSRKNLVQNANNAVARAEKDLANTVSGTDTNRIKSQKAIVAQAVSRVASARAQAAKNVLSAPFSGVVTEVNVTAGELSSMTKPAISIISDNAFQVKVKIAEVDIAKMKIGNTATVTLDAYRDQEFAAVLSRIDPSATIEGGVPRYGAVLSFVNKDDRIRSGMTANAKVVTRKIENALTVKASFIQIKTGGGIVKVMNATSTEDRIVKVGVRGSDGSVEILEGVTESDKLVEIATDTK